MKNILIFPYRLEPLKSALDLHREKFAQRLERSTADRTRRQEEAWARLDRCPSPIYEHPKIKRYVVYFCNLGKAQCFTMDQKI